MSEAIEIAAVYKLPASLVFTGSCLGTSAPVHIAGMDGQVYLPPGTSVSRGIPILLPPALYDLPSQAERHLYYSDPRPERQWLWGRVIELDTIAGLATAANVTALLFRFRDVEPGGITYMDYLYGRGQPTGGAVQLLFEHIDAWFEALRIWIRILTDQDVDPDVEANLVSVPAENLEVLTVEGGTVSLPRRANNMRIAMLEVEKLDEQLWRKALNFANQKHSPPLEYLFANSARIQFRINEYRRAIIDAASAVELSLSELLQVNFVNLPTGLQNVLSQSNTPTLGWFIDTLTRAGGLPSQVTSISSRLPSDLKTGLNDVRRDVIHRHRTPTYDEALRAVAIAAEVVKTVNPLP